MCLKSNCKVLKLFQCQIEKKYVAYVNMLHNSLYMVSELNKIKYKNPFSENTISSILQNLPIHKPCYCSAGMFMEGQKISGMWSSNTSLPFSERPKRNLPAGVLRALGVSPEEEKLFKKQHFMINVLEDGECGAHVLSVVYTVLISHSFYSHLPKFVPSPKIIRELICNFAVREYPDLDENLYRENMFFEGKVRYLEAPEIVLWCQYFSLNCGIFGYTPGVRNRQDYVLNTHVIKPTFPWIFLIVTNKANHYELMTRVDLETDRFCVTFSPEQAFLITSRVQSSVFQSPPQSFFDNIHFMYEDFVWENVKKKKQKK